MKAFLRNSDGRWRAPWRVAAACAAWLAAFYGALAGLGAAFGALFDAWGLTTANLSYAPKWTQWIVYLHTDICYALAYLLSGLASLALVRKDVPSSGGLRAAALGAGMMALIAAISLAMDSVRLEYSIIQPAFAWSQLWTLIVLALGRWSAETLLRRALFAQLRSAGHRWAGYFVSAAATVLLAQAWSGVWALIAALLLGIVCCALYERGGLAASTGFQIGWTVWATLVFGFPGMGAQAVYPMYHVSDAWLTGGSAGPAAGAWMALVLMGIAARLLRSEIAQTAKCLKGRKKRAWKK